MKELTTQTGIIVKCSKTAIEFFQNAQSVDFFSALEIPKEFQDIAVEFYDLILENDHPTALLGCRGNYDIAVQIDEVTGTMTGGTILRFPCILQVPPAASPETSHSTHTLRRM